MEISDGLELAFCTAEEEEEVIQDVIITTTNFKAQLNQHPLS
jgi:hypothetical protein